MGQCINLNVDFPLDRLLPLVFLYNASEAIFRIKWATSIDLPASTAAIPLRPAQQPLATSSPSSFSTTPSQMKPISTATYKSSPKTRPSAGILPSPSITTRTQPPTSNADHKQPAPPPTLTNNSITTTPSRLFRPDYGLNESPTAALRRSLLATAGTPPGQFQSSTDSSSYRSYRVGPPPSEFYNQSSGVGDTFARDSANPRMEAYWVRHAPAVSNLHRSVSAKADIDRILAAEA